MLSDKQQRYRLALSLIPCFVAPLSLIGSMIIVIRILRFDRHDPGCANRKVYLRLLFGLSVCDVVASLAASLGRIPVPREMDLWGAYGTTATCTAQGFFFQFMGGGILFYNAGLMIYFLLTIRHGWSDTRFAKRLEWIVHIWSIAASLAAAVICLCYDAFNPNVYGTQCYISVYPPLCGFADSSPCTRGQAAHFLYLSLVLTPMIIVAIILFSCLFLIYGTVRSQGRLALRIAANRESIESRTNAVAIQSVFYGVVFFNTYVYLLLNEIVSDTMQAGPQQLLAMYILGILNGLISPMQGMLNCILYLRPRFTRLKREDNVSTWRAIKGAVFGGKETFRPSPTRSGRRRSSLKVVSPGARRPSMSMLTQQPASSLQLSQRTITMISNNTPGEAAHVTDDKQNEKGLSNDAVHDDSKMVHMAEDLNVSSNKEMDEDNNRNSQNSNNANINHVHHQNSNLYDGNVTAST